MEEEKGEQFGKAFEHFILMEIAAYDSYKEIDFDINFWRTKSGLKVDFILGNGQVAIEVKGTSRVDNNSLKPIETFIDEYFPQKAFTVCNESEERIKGKVRILPYREFLSALWKGEIIK